jgi:hypothetical protein
MASAASRLAASGRHAELAADQVDGAEGQQASASEVARIHGLVRSQRRLMR